jgi:hypothetical protein
MTLTTSILDFLGNDTTGVYKLTEYGEFSAGSYELEIAEPKQFYYLPKVLSFGDYDNSCQVERSNVRVFLERFKGHKDILHRTGGYGSEFIAIDITTTDTEILETLAALSEYPVMDEEDMSNMEQEMINEAWQSYGQDDFLRALYKKFGADDIRKGADVYGLYVSHSGQPEIEAGGSVWFNTEKVIEAITEAPDFLIFW